MRLHIEGQGDPVQLARSIHTALAQTKTPLTAPASSGQSQQINLDTRQLDAILKYHGKANNGIYQYTIPCAEKITDGGMDIPPALSHVHLGVCSIRLAVVTQIETPGEIARYLFFPKDVGEPDTHY